MASRRSIGLLIDGWAQLVGEIPAVAGGASVVVVPGSVGRAVSPWLKPGQFTPAPINTSSAVDRPAAPPIVLSSEGAIVPSPLWRLRSPWAPPGFGAPPARNTSAVFDFPPPGPSGPPGPAHYWGPAFPDARLGTFFTTAAHAALSLAPTVTNSGAFDLVSLVALVGGAAGNAITVQQTSDALTDGGQVSVLGNAIHIQFSGNATTLAQWAALVAATGLISVVGTYDPLAICATGDDEFPATALTGGTDSKASTVTWWGPHFPDSDPLATLINGVGPSGAATFALSIEAGFQVSFSWGGDVIKSYSGLEYRAATLDDPKQTYQGPALLLGADTEALRVRLQQFAALGQAFLLGLPYEAMTLTGPATSTTVPVPSTALCDWALPGQRVVVMRIVGDQVQSVNAIIQAVTPSTFVLDVAPGAIGAYGASIMPAVAIYLDPQQSFDRYKPATPVEAWKISARAAYFGYFSAPTLAALSLGVPVTNSGAATGVTLVAQSSGAAGNLITVQFQAATLGVGIACTVGESGTACLVRFRSDGTTTMTQLATAIANGSALISVTGTYNLSATLAPGADEFGPKALTGGADLSPGTMGVGAAVKTYFGQPLWDRGVDSDGTIPDSMQSMVEIVDLGGLPFSTGTALVPDYGRHVAIQDRLGPEWQWLKAFLFAIRGSQVSFWLPTFRQDLVAVSGGPGGTGTGTIKISSTVGDFFVWWPAPRAHVRIDQGSASYYVNVAAAVDNHDGTLTLTIRTDPADLTATLPTTAAIDNITWLEICRMETDDVPVSFTDDKFSMATTARVVRQFNVSITPVGLPVPSFTFAAIASTVTFTDTSTDAAATIVAWAWTFGDGGTSIAQNPVHVYSATGTYAVTETITDSLGAVSSTTTSVSVTAAAAGLMLIAIHGQSNMVSPGGTVAGLSAGNAAFANPYPAVKYFSKISGLNSDPIVWVDYTAAGYIALQPQSVSQFSIELSMGQQLDAAFPNRIVIAKEAVSGAGLEVNWLSTVNYPTSPPAGPNLFAQSVAYDQAAMAATGATFAAMCWGGCETDALSGTWSADVTANLTTNITAWRAAFGNFPFIMTEVNGVFGYADASTVRAQQVVFTNTTPWVTMINADDLAFNGSGHYVSDSLITLGQRFATAIQQALVTTTLTGTLASTAGTLTSAGQAYAYTLDLTAVSIDANNVAATITLPAQATYVSASGTGWSLSHSGQVVTATRATGSAGAQPTITVNVTGPATGSSGTITATSATVSSNVKTTLAKSVDVTLALPAATKDATSGIYIPQTAAEYVALGLPAPNSIYRLQDSGSPLVDSLSAINLAVSGSGASYRGAVPSWSSLAAFLTDGTVGSWVSVSSSLPDLSTTSSLLLAYVLFPAGTPAGNRTVGILGGSTALSWRLNQTTPRVEAISGGNAGTVGTNDPRGAVRLCWLKADHTNGHELIYTDQEKLSVTPAAVTGKGMRLGSSAAAGAFGYIYAARWDGLNAEQSDATIKAWSQALGWTIPWS